jgi:hypothetical protein
MKTIQDKSEPAMSSSTHQYAGEPRANQLHSVQPPPCSAPQPAPTSSLSQTPPSSTQTAAVSPVDVDVGETSIHSYSSPDPIHLTIHTDPAEEAEMQKKAENEAVSECAAIAYLQSVHPALPRSSPSSPSSSNIQLPEAARQRRNSEGAATSLSGLWTPLQPAFSPSPSPPPIHGDQVYASEEPPLQSPPMQGRCARTGVHDQQFYTTSERVERERCDHTGRRHSLPGERVLTKERPDISLPPTEKVAAGQATDVPRQTALPSTSAQKRVFEGDSNTSQIVQSSAGEVRVSSIPSTATRLALANQSSLTNTREP